MNTRNRGLLLVVSLLMTVASSVGAATTTATAADKLVPMPPCRLLDTRTEPLPQGASEASRRIDFLMSRCGALIPSFATAYSFEVMTYRKEGAGLGSIVSSPALSRMTAATIGSLDFPIPAGLHVSVDIVGYFIPADMILNPTMNNSLGVSHPKTGESAVDSLPHSVLRTGTNAVTTGSAGNIVLDGTSPAGSLGGVYLGGTPSSPWIVLQSGNNAAASSAFWFANSGGTSLFEIQADGNAFFRKGTMSVRTNYSELTSKVIGNVVHDVTILNPKDSDGNATNPVVFYNARSSDEYQAASTTKFKAFTVGYYGPSQGNINFDSQINYATGGSYHFRAFAPWENKDTFWVVPATSTPATPSLNVRADMYLSGYVGFGVVPNTTNRIEVAGNIHATGNISADGIINAKYQDLAEWVPAQSGMSAGTVVVLNRARKNEVLPSSRAYDTTVAGVVSAQPGLILGEGSDSKAKIATTGRVKVHVDATKSPIAIGDLLVTSDKSGTAMKSEPVQLSGIAFHRPGTIVGKALEPLPSGEGDILVLLSLQ